jgi:formamidopyrimidine-DNA glycosylase
MPELPEVERVRLSLVPHLRGRRIVTARLFRADICESYGPSLKVVDTTPAALLEGDRVEALERRGKQLAIIGRSGRVLSVHLGMSGQLLWKRAGEPLPGSHVHAAWEIGGRGDAGTLVFRDPRRFGGLWTFESVEDLHAARWNALGPDALTITSEQLAEGLRGSRRAIKAALLDQSVAAGVGNIYADEALFLAGLRPTRQAGRLTGEQVEKLASAVREVLRRSIESGGTTLRDYVDANGERGRAQDGHLVYGRGGEPCRGCGAKLRQGLVAQRTTVWCHRCQR